MSSDICLKYSFQHEGIDRCPRGAIHGSAEDERPLSQRLPILQKEAIPGIDAQVLEKRELIVDIGQ
jgi:hypothetical protein